MKAFWAVLSLLVTLNYFSLNLIGTLSLKTEMISGKSNFELKEPSIILSIVLSILLVVLIIADFLERNKKNT